MSKIYCPNCGEMREVIVRREKETFLIDGEVVSVDADVSRCRICGQQVWNEKLDTANLKRAQDKHRTK